MADLFGLEAGAPDEGLSAAGCAALSGWYEQASQELAATLETLPAAVLNGAPDRAQVPLPVAADAGAVRPGRASTEDGRDNQTGGDQ